MKRLMVVLVALTLCWSAVVAQEKPTTTTTTVAVRPAAVPVPVVPANIVVKAPLAITDATVAVFDTWKKNVADGIAEPRAQQVAMYKKGKVRSDGTGVSAADTAEYKRLSGIINGVCETEYRKLPLVNAQSHAIGAVGRLSGMPPNEYDGFFSVTMSKVGVVNGDPILSLDGTIFWFKGEGSNRFTFHDIQPHVTAHNAATRAISDTQRAQAKSPLFLSEQYRVSAIVQVVDVLTVPTADGGTTELVVVRIAHEL